MIVALQDIQSIKKATYDFGDKGVCVITGDNSNGKSIVFKAIGAIVNLKIMDKEERESLINDYADFGVIALLYNGNTLTCKVHRDRNQCIVQLKRSDGTSVRRTFREGGIKELIDEFGFCCYSGNSVCLQLYETLGLMPFVNTTNKTNGEIVEDVTEDHIAKQFLTNYKEVTYKAAIAQMKEINMKIDSLKRVRDSLIVYDYRKYMSFYEEMSKLYEQLKYIDIISLEKLVLVPAVVDVDIPKIKLEKLRLPIDVEVVDIRPPKLEKFVCVKLIPTIDILDNLSEDINALQQVMDGKCPTCGKAFIE